MDTIVNTVPNINVVVSWYTRPINKNIQPVIRDAIYTSFKLKRISLNPVAHTFIVDSSPDNIDMINIIM
jgi:hypothetical protein